LLFWVLETDKEKIGRYGVVEKSIESAKKEGFSAFSA